MWTDAGAFGSVNAHAGLAAQTRDLILQVQLATLDFQDFQIVSRGMLLSFGELGFQ
jgi:hypothetical protein